jgi:hypothetical protein
LRQQLAAIPPNPSINALTPSGTAVVGIGRTNGGLPGDGSAGSVFKYSNECGPLGFNAFETIIATDNTKTIVSLVFTNSSTSGNDYSNVLAVSAIP